MAEAEENWTAKYINEVIGTFILIFLGDGAVVASIITGAYGLFGAAIGWGFAVMFAVYWAGGVSSAHINPAVTLGFATWRDFPWKHVPGYIISQIVGAFLAAATLYFTWLGYYQSQYQQTGIFPGEPGSSVWGATLWTFFPHPVFAGLKPFGDLTRLEQAANLVSFPQAFFSELVITAILVGLIFALVDDWNPMGTRDDPGLGGFLIGLVVAALVLYEAPISMAALNPARDLGPRIFGYLVGFGDIAFPGPRGGWWLPSVSTAVGGIIGGGLYDLLTRRELFNIEEGPPEETPPGRAEEGESEEPSPSASE
jgi:glycerol uptake facilitator protein